MKIYKFVILLAAMSIVAVTSAYSQIENSETLVTATIKAVENRRYLYAKSLFKRAVDVKHNEDTTGYRDLTVPRVEIGRVQE